MVYFILAAVALAGSLTLFLVSRNLASKVREIAGTETSDAASLAGLAASVAKEIGAGSFTQAAELKGKALRIEELKADFSGTPCVWYECTVTRDWEEEYWETDDKGNRVRRTRSGSDQVSHILREPPFELEDATGRIRVDPRGAKVEPERTWSSYESGAAPSVSIGSFVLGAIAAAAGGRRTLGYRFEERSIPEGRELYILGEAADAGGTLKVRKPEKGRFIVSTRSEEAIIKGARTGLLWTRISAAVALAAALATALAAFVAGG